VVLRVLVAALLVVCVGYGTALAQLCWDTVTPRNFTGFDFEIASRVEGPSPAGIYTYTYTFYRRDNGFTRYKGVSHVAVRFPCGLDAQRSILNGAMGITMTCREGSCPKVELGGLNGMSEPAMNSDCRFFWGFKLYECGAEGGYFLLPHVDEVSYPFDWMDPFCTITFRSGAEPELGTWVVKGGARDGDDGRSEYYDAGYVWVPTCLPAVSAGEVTWGSIKVLYR